MGEREFELGTPEIHGEYTKIPVIGLDEICSKSCGKTWPCDGAVGLLHDCGGNHRGYSKLYYVYRGYPNEETGEVNLTFTPAYTREGEEIFIRTRFDSPFLIFDRAYDDYVMKDGKYVKEKKPATLTYRTEGW